MKRTQNNKKIVSQLLLGGNRLLLEDVVELIKRVPMSLDSRMKNSSQEIEISSQRFEQLDK